MAKKIALLSLVAAALIVVPSGLAARHETPKPGTPAALAAKLKLKTLEARRFTHLFVVHCHASATTNPSGPIVKLPICTKTGTAIVGGLKKLDLAIQAKLAGAKSGSKAATLLQALHVRVGKVVAELQTAVAAAPSVGVGTGDSGNA